MKQQFVVVVVNLGIGGDVMKIRDPMGLVGVTSKSLLRDQEVGLFELVLDVSTGWEWETTLEV